MVWLEESSSNSILKSLSEFQFHYGLIRSLYKTVLQTQDQKFQFHYGLIRSR